jgi:hypothetical protein
MSRLEPTPFFKFGSLKSQDQNSPDVLELQVLNAETFETMYSINVRVLLKDGESNKEIILPLKNHESKNPSLLRDWEMARKKGLLTPNRRFRLKTWLDTSKNGRQIRRFKLVF